MTGKQWMVEWITDEGATNQTIYDNYTDAKKRFDTLNSYKYRRKKKYSEVHMYSRIITSWQEIKE